MSRRARSRLQTLLLATALAAGTATLAPAEPLAAPGGTFVIDGGDIEAASLARGSCLDPALADDAAVAPSLRATVTALADPVAATQTAPASRPMAFEYSDGYYTRLKIHKWASYATLPLFVAQYAVGQKLYDGNVSDSTRSLHGGLAASTAVLFGVNTVTGVWNLAEGRKDPNHRTKRMVHGILMMVADAGFVATGMTAPDDEGEGGGSPSTHRNVALASMGVATVAYLMMLIH
jgi:hypothetical protein